MEEKETRLQKILRQESEKIGRAILEEIENGEKVETSHDGYGVFVGNTFINAPINSIKGSKPCIVLQIEQPEIAKLFEPSKETLQKEADELRAKLAKIQNELKTQEK